MSISQALGILEEKLFKEIPKERIRNIGKTDKEMIETSSAEVVINENNVEDRKILERIYSN